MGALQRVETVDFLGDELAAARDGEAVRVVLKPMCDALGLRADAQMLRLEKLGWATPHRMTAVGSDGKAREMLTLDLDSVPLWLATIQVSRVTAALRPKLLRYQRECARVLRNHFVEPPALPAVRVERIIDSGPRMGDSPEGRAEVLRRCEITRKAADVTLRQVLGFVRRMARTSSPYFVTDMYWRDSLVRMLDDLAMGKFFLAGGRVRGRLVADTRQQKLFGVN